MDSHKRSDVVKFVCVLALAAILLPMLQPVESLAFFSLPTRPTPAQSCETHKCGWEREYPGEAIAAPIAPPIARYVPPTPIQWRAHSPAWPADFRRTRR